MKEKVKYGLIGWVHVHDISLYVCGLIEELPILPPDFASVGDWGISPTVPSQPQGDPCSPSFHDKTCDIQCRA